MRFLRVTGVRVDLGCERRDLLLDDVADRGADLFVLFAGLVEVEHHSPKTYQTFSKVYYSCSARPLSRATCRSCPR